jgi:hypothetical protein
MKKAKYGLLIIVIGFITTVIYQNLEFLREAHGFHLNLMFIGKYVLPVVSNGVYFTTLFLLGILISYFFSLSDRFKNKQTIKNLTATIDSHRDVISSLEIELNALKGRRNESADRPGESASVSQEAVS